MHTVACLGCHGITDDCVSKCGSLKQAVEGHSSRKSDAQSKPHPQQPRQQKLALGPLPFLLVHYLIDDHHNGKSTLLIRSYSSISQWWRIGIDQAGIG